MRIIAGQFKGKKLFQPSNKEIRPSSDRLRETIFGILEGGRYGKPLESEVIIDLFSGTGALGLEAFSRGNPKKMIFVDNSISSINIIKSNIEHLKIDPQRITLLSKNAESWSDWNEKKSGLIFSDPPYFSQLSENAISSLVNIGAIKNGAIFVIETSDKELTPNIEKISLIESRRIGKSKIHFLIYKK